VAVPHAVALIDRPPPATPPVVQPAAV